MPQIASEGVVFLVACDFDTTSKITASSAMVQVYASAQYSSNPESSITYEGSSVQKSSHTILHALTLNATHVRFQHRFSLVPRSCERCREFEIVVLYLMMMSTWRAPYFCVTYNDLPSSERCTLTHGFNLLGWATKGLSCFVVKFKKKQQNTCTVQGTLAVGSVDASAPAPAPAPLFPRRNPRLQPNRDNILEPNFSAREPLLAEGGHIPPAYVSVGSLTAEVTHQEHGNEAAPRGASTDEGEPLLPPPLVGNSGAVGRADESSVIGKFKSVIRTV